MHATKNINTKMKKTRPKPDSVGGGGKKKKKIFRSQLFPFFGFSVSAATAAVGIPHGA